jgi:hypothetical protein
MKEKCKDKSLKNAILAAVKKWLYLISLMLFFVANTNATKNDFFSVREVVAAKGVSRIQAGSLKEFKSLVQQLSKPGSQLTKTELKQFEKLTEQFGGKLRYDLNPVKGKILQPHVQVEGLGTSVGSRHIWLGQ